MNNQIDKNQIFYDTYLGEPDRHTPAIVTGLGVASFTVTNEKLLNQIKQVAEVDEVEGEFAFIRNKHLHYKLSNDSEGVGHGVLTVRACKSGGNSVINQFIVVPDYTYALYRMIPFDSDVDMVVRFYDSAVENNRDRLANAIGYSFK